jgi:hypothetical protein
LALIINHFVGDGTGWILVAIVAVGPFTSDVLRTARLRDLTSRARAEVDPKR